MHFSVITAKFLSSPPESLFPVQKIIYDCDTKRSVDTYSVPPSERSGKSFLWPKYNDYHHNTNVFVSLVL